MINIMKLKLTAEEQKTVQRMGLALRAARIEAGQTQDEFAARIGVSRWTVAAMEKDGSKVSLGAWLKAGTLLDLMDSWDNVFQKEDDPFARYDREQAQQQTLLKTRVRK